MRSYQFILEYNDQLYGIFMWNEIIAKKGKVIE